MAIETNIKNKDIFALYSFPKQNRTTVKTLSRAFVMRERATKELDKNAASVY